MLRDEILLPHGIDAEESVHLTDFPEFDAAYRDDGFAQTWEKLIGVRKDVLKPIEDLRIEKTIGHSLESEVTLFADGELYDLLKTHLGELAELFVVSKVLISKKNGTVGNNYKGDLVDVRVNKSTARKCERCWRYLESVGKDETYPDLCDRCAEVVTDHYADQVGKRDDTDR